VLVYLTWALRAGREEPPATDQPGVA